MADISKREYKTLGDAVGMPDDIDKKNVRNIIDGFERRYPGLIKFYKDNARRESAAFNNPRDDFGVVDATASRRYIMELPPLLFNQLEAYIPTIFREKRHFRWLVKNFKELVIPRRY